MNYPFMFAFMYSSFLFSIKQINILGHSVFVLYACNIFALMQKHSSAFSLFTFLQGYLCAAQYFKVTAGGTSDLCSFLSVQSDTSCRHGSLSAANVGFSASQPNLLVVVEEVFTSFTQVKRALPHDRNNIEVF